MNKKVIDILLQLNAELGLTEEGRSAVIILDPITTAKLVTSVYGLFNPDIVNENIHGLVGEIAGFLFRMSPNPINTDEEAIARHKINELLNRWNRVKFL